MKILLILTLFISGVYAQSAADLCKQLTGDGSGKDAKARVDLMKMAHNAAKKEGPARESHEAAVLAAIKSSKSTEVSTFLIQQLEICGGKAALPVVGSYLNNKELCTNATRAFIHLTQYDRNKAAEILFSALGSASADNKANLVNAVSVLKYTDSRAQSAYKSALSGDKFAKIAGLQGLAISGNPADSGIMLSALQKADKVSRPRVFRLNIVYTETLAAKNKASANGHLSRLSAQVKGTEIPYITGIASVDFNINGVTDKWLDKLENANIHTQTGIIRLFKANNYDGLIAKLKSRIESKPDKAIYIEALAGADAPSAAPYVTKGLGSSNAEVKAVCTKLSVRYGSSAAAAVIAAVVSKPKVEAADIERLKSMINSSNVVDTLAHWKGNRQDIDLAFIEITGSIRKTEVAAKMLTASVSGDKKVKSAALKTLKNVVSARELNSVLGLLAKETSSSAVRYLQLAAAVGISGSDKVIVEKIASKLSSARDDKLLGALARSNRVEGLGVIKKDITSKDAGIQKNIIKIVGNMKPELSTGLLLMVIENAVDERNRIIAARAFASAITESTEDNKVRTGYINKALQQKLPAAEKKLLEERKKQIPANSQSKPSENDSGYTPLFNGKDLDNWDNSGDYKVKDGIISGKSGRLFSKQKFKDFSLKFDFKLEPGTNNGLAIRSPSKGKPIELQIIDNAHKKYEKIKDYQRHGSIYNYVPAKTGFLKKTGEWNSQEVICKGSIVKVILNGTVILEADLKTVKPIGNRYVVDYINKATEGHIGFLGHNSPVSFRKIMIKEL